MCPYCCARGTLSRHCAKSTACAWYVCSHCKATMRPDKGMGVRQDASGTECFTWE